MNRNEFLTIYWRYYLFLENKFRKTLDYVELDKSNFSTYSIEYAHLLLAICSELDSLFKTYCGFRLDDPKTMTNYKSHILSDYPEIVTQKVIVINTAIELTPYENWTNVSLAWWKAYNSVKHSRQLNQASMENILNALAALFLLEMKTLQKLTDVTQEFDDIKDGSSIFKLKNWILE